MKDHNLFKSTAQTALNVNFTGCISFADSEPFELSPLLFSKKIVMPTGDSLFSELWRMSKVLGIRDIFNLDVLEAVITRYEIDYSQGLIAATKQLLGTSMQCPLDKFGLEFIQGKAISGWIKTKDSKTIKTQQYWRSSDNQDASMSLREELFDLSIVLKRRANDLAKAASFLTAVKSTIQELGCQYELVSPLKNIDEVTSTSELIIYITDLLPTYLLDSKSALSYCLASFLNGDCTSRPAPFEQNNVILRSCQPSALASRMNEAHQKLFFQLFTNYTERSW